MSSSYHTTDKERLIGSILLGIAFHGALFFGLQFLGVWDRKPSPESTGPVFVELESEEIEIAKKEEAPPPEEIPPEEVPPEEIPPEEVPPEEIPPEIEEPDENAIPLYTPRPSGTIKPTKTPNFKATPTPYRRTPKPTNRPTTKPRDRTPKPTTAKTSAPKATQKPTEESALDLGNLGNLDIAISQTAKPNDNNTGNTDSTGTTNTTGTNSGTGTQNSGPEGTAIEWEDNANRQVISQQAPVLPDWVQEKGLYLDVEVSFTLTPAGILTSVKANSPYSDINSAFETALKRWRFASTTGTKSIDGKLTYKIRPRSD